MIFTSLSGNNAHWSIIGVTSIYLETNQSFRVYLKWEEGSGGTLTVPKAK